MNAKYYDPSLKGLPPLVFLGESDYTIKGPLTHGPGMTIDTETKRRVARWEGVRGLDEKAEGIKKYKLDAVHKRPTSEQKIHTDWK